MHVPPKFQPNHGKIMCFTFCFTFCLAIYDIKTAELYIDNEYYLH